MPPPVTDASSQQKYPNKWDVCVLAAKISLYLLWGCVITSHNLFFFFFIATGGSSGPSGLMFFSHALRFNLRGGSSNLVRFMLGPLISRVVFGPPSRAPAVSQSIIAAHRGPVRSLLIVNVSRLISNNYTGVLPLWCLVLSAFSSLTSLGTLNLTSGLGNTHHWYHCHFVFF